jgi:hypothetical protein
MTPTFTFPQEIGPTIQNSMAHTSHAFLVASIVVKRVNQIACYLMTRKLGIRGNSTATNLISL